MGFGRFLGDLLSGKTNCPLCGTPGSSKEGDRVRCLNPQCPNFLLMPGEAPAQPKAVPPQSVIPASQPAASAGSSSPGSSSTSSSGSSRTVTIEYKNFQNQQRTFVADIASMRRKKNHIVVRLAPGGKVLSLSRDRIQNMSEVDAVLPAYMRSGAPYPTAKERQVLGYHKKHKSTSPLYEQIRAKFPDW